MVVESKIGPDPDYLRLQAGRCQRLSQSCMDLGTARDLRLMAEQFFSESTKLRLKNSAPYAAEITPR